MCLDRHKNHVCGPEKNICYTWGCYLCKMLRTQALCQPSLLKNWQQRWSPWRQILQLELLAFHQKDNWVFFWTFSFNIIKYFPSNLKLQHCQTIVLLHCFAAFSHTDRLPNLLNNGAPLLWPLAAKELR